MQFADGHKEMMYPPFTISEPVVGADGKIKIVVEFEGRTNSGVGMVQRTIIEDPKTGETVYIGGNGQGYELNRVCPQLDCDRRVTYKDLARNTQDNRFNQTLNTLSGFGKKSSQTVVPAAKEEEGKGRSEGLDLTDTSDFNAVFEVLDIWDQPTGKTVKAPFSVIREHTGCLITDFADAEKARECVDNIKGDTPDELVDLVDAIQGRNTSVKWKTNEDIASKAPKKEEPQQQSNIKCMANYEISENGDILVETDSSEISDNFKKTGLLDDDGYITQTLLLNIFKKPEKKINGKITLNQAEYKLFQEAAERSIKYAKDHLDHPDFPDSKPAFTDQIETNTALLKHFDSQTKNGQQPSLNDEQLLDYARFIDRNKDEHFYEGKAKNSKEEHADWFSVCENAAPRMRCCQADQLNANNIVAQSLCSKDFLSGEENLKVFQSKEATCKNLSVNISDKTVTRLGGTSEVRHGGKSGSDI